MSNAPSASDALTMARTFFDALCANAPPETALVVPTPPSWHPTVLAADVPAQAARYAVRLGTDVYVGCAFYAAGVRARRAEHTCAVGSVWADVDVAKPGATKCYLPDLPAARAAFGSLPIRPTLTVCSGSGLHGWWCFREAIPIATEADRVEASRLVRRWQGYLRQRLAPYALDATHDLARVLRVPGTVNTKYGVPVVLENASGPRVNPAELA